MPYQKIICQKDEQCDQCGKELPKGEIGYTEKENTDYVYCENCINS